MVRFFSGLEVIAPRFLQHSSSLSFCMLRTPYHKSGPIFTTFFSLMLWGSMSSACFIMVHRFPFHPELYHFLKFLSWVLREYWYERWLVITGSNFYIQKCLHFLCIETAGRQTCSGRQKDVIELQSVIRPSDCILFGVHILFWKNAPIVMITEASFYHF